MNEAYNVAVKLSLNNQVSAGLMAMSGQFTKLQAQATALQTRLNAIKTLGLVGMGLAAGGFFGLHLIGKALKPAEEYAHQLNIMNMAGMKQKDIADAVGLAWKNTSTVITTTATENLRMLNDMRIVFGDLGEAKMALPLVSQMQAVLMSSKEGRAAAQDKDFAFSVAKALDIIGAVKNKDEFMKEANMMSKTVTAFQGRVTPKMFQSTFAYARQAKYAMNDEFKYEIMPTLMMEYAMSGGGAGGGSRGVGPMIAAMYRMTNQGYINKKALPELQRVGLVPKGSELKTTTSGTTVGPMTGYQLAGANPYLWVQQVLVPALNKTYGKKGVPLTREELQFHINQLFRGNQLAASLMTEFAVKPYAFDRDQKLVRQALPTDKAYQQALMNDPQLARTALADQWENVQTALTVPLVSVLIPALMHLATALNTVAQVLIKYPALAQALSYGLTALFGAMALGGVVLLITAAFQGLGAALSIISVPLLALGAPILGIAAALVLMGFGAYKLYQFLKAANWKNLGAEAQKAWTELKKITFVQLVEKYKAFMVSMVQVAINAFKQFFSWLGSAISSIVGSIGNAFKGFVAGWKDSEATSRAQGLDGKKGGYSPYQSNAYGSNILNFSPKSGASSAVGKPQASNAGANATIQVASNIHLDGRQIARVVTEHQVKSATRVPNYSQGFDPNMSPTPMVLKGNIA